jgi:hypothetical protein
MKTKPEIQKMLKEVEEDERLYYPAADVFSNAPLALIQVGLANRSDVLRDVLGMPHLNLKKIRAKKK